MLDSSATKPKLLVIGDALEDIYMHGEWGARQGALRFKPHEILKFCGGAANTLANARAILGNKARVQEWMNLEPLALYRFIESDIRESYIQIAGENSLELPAKTLEIVDGIIISDYNKGTVNKPQQNLETISPWIIVDSRYRSLHQDFLKLGKIKIWRCTGEEYNFSWAQQFDLIVHTDAALNICIVDSGGKILYDFPVPKIEPIDVCGAGDTFTATLGAQLLLDKYDDPFALLRDCSTFSSYPPRLAAAVPLCIKAAQDVCMKKYTATTTEKL